MCIMEKRKAHYDLNALKAVVAARGMDAFMRAGTPVIQFKEK
jgi:hypothetical protein